MDKNLLIKTLRNTLAAAVYIFLVSQIMQNGEKLFGKEDNAFIPFAVLLLFSLSAAVVGGLVLGEAIFLFFDNKKKESVKAAVYSVMWLAVITFISLLVLILLK